MRSGRASITKEDTVLLETLKGRGLVILSDPESSEGESKDLWSFFVA
jgi:hypothetical protein